MKKAWNALVALVATLGMAFAGFVGVSSAYADDAQNYTISTASDDSHTYEIYQIFVGDLSQDQGTLSNIKGGENYNGSNAAEDAEKLIAEVAALSTDAEKAAAIAKYADLSSPYTTVAGNGGSVSVPAGYYLIKDKDASLDGKDDAYTVYIATIVRDTVINRKADKPTVEKKVKDKNDSTGDESGWQDSADADFGDLVDFQLTATLPTDQTQFDNYKTYALTFHDTMSAGLDFESGTVKVMVGDTEIKRGEGFEVIAPGTDGATFDVKIDDIKAAVPGVAAGTKVVVTYQGKLNDKAVIGSTGNPNEVSLEYSNNPNSEGTGKTPKDKVIVFTYEVDVNKTKQDGTALEGAGFTLYKKVDGDWKQVGNEVKASAGAGSNVAKFERLDDGNYKLVETTVPDGYNKCNDVEFTISAEHDTTSDDPKLTGLTISGPKATVDTDAGLGSFGVINVPGSNLPSTGGMGTTLLYIAGAVIVVAAGLGLAMVMRKRNAR